jgi:hypothetical protein
MILYIIIFLFKVSFYSNSIFLSAGFTTEVATYCTIGLGVVQLVMTFVCMILIERAGRRILLLAGMIGMSLSSFGLSTFLTLTQKVQTYNNNFLNCN